MATDQASDIDVLQHRQGKHEKHLKLTDVEYSPGVFLYCDVSENKKIRPILLTPE